ncbi:MAG: hypothetical protein AB8C13_06645 [Phycisphaerales bacterium]
MGFLKRVMIGAAVGALLLGAEVRGAEPVLETVTYQGVLNDGGSPANGMYDIKFQYFDELGNPFGTTVTFLEYEVVDGLFSLPIEFTNVFGFGDRRFLEVSVRAAGTAVFSDLSPRQEITAAPYSVYAIKAGEAETAVVAETAIVAESSLDNEWDRFGTVLSAGENNDRVLFQPDLTGGFLINSFTDFQLNFDNPSFGGMYINSENSGGSPFYGFSVDGVEQGYIEFSPSTNEMRFFSPNAFEPTLTLGADTAAVNTLAADDDIVKDYGVGEFYRHGPIAYGTVGSNGSVVSGTGNFSAVWDGGIGRYEISVDGENMTTSLYTFVVNAISTTPAVVNTASISGDLLVYIHSLSDVNIQKSFSFVIYKNTEVVVD